MASSYERKFVFFEPKDKGFESTAGRTPKGHIEIERKGNRISLKVFVENLRKNIYEVQCLTPEGKMTRMGDLNVLEDGRCQAEFKGNGEDLMNSGLPWEACQVIVIRPQGEGNQTALAAWLKGTKGPIPVPMMEKEEKGMGVKPESPGPTEDRIPMGFKPEEPKQEEHFEQPPEEGEKEEDPKLEWEDPSKEEEEAKDEMDKVEDEVNVEDEVEDEDQGQVEGYQDLEPEDQALYREKYQGLEEELSKEYWVDFGADYPEERTHQEDSEVDLTTPYYYINEYMEGFKEAVQECQPFDPPISHHTWWRISREEKELEKYYLFYNGSFVHLTYPYMDYKNFGEMYIQEYDELIFGLAAKDHTSKKQLGYYVYGIPGRFCIQEQPFQGTTGFLYWHPMKGHQRERGAMGYWLLYIDAQTGGVSVPKRPTIPPVCRD